jgi:uncharacterized ferritin-like protein (DUF455 family)
VAGSLFDAALACLRADSPESKLAATAQAGEGFARGLLHVPADATPPLPITQPGRPPRPRLVEPRELPRRGLGSDEGRAAFLHAIAHIEFNAIDLAWDAVYRFRGMPEAYYADWVGVAVDEARHFQLLQERMALLGHRYGDFDAHNGLWEMAEKTAGSCLQRMALVPRVLEARGLDVTPGMISKLRGLGDGASVAVLEVILAEEVAHVAAGSRWFRHCCALEGVDPGTTFRELLRAHAGAVLRGPFNTDARAAAGFDEDELEMLLAFDEVR